MADQEEWNRRVLSRASEDLLELKNDSWLEEYEEELDAEKFEACLEPVSYTHLKGRLLGENSLYVQPEVGKILVYQPANSVPRRVYRFP